MLRCFEQRNEENLTTRETQAPTFSYALPMTTIHTTPSVWVALRSYNAGKALTERIQTFADGHTLSDPKQESGRVMHAVGTHASAWLVIDAGAAMAEELQDLAFRCVEMNDCFRCLVIGAENAQNWPAKTVHLPAHALSSSILDRLRLESHALRIQSRRSRTVAALRQRP